MAVLTLALIEKALKLKGKFIQEEIAYQLGISKSTVGRIHRGRAHPTVDDRGNYIGRWKCGGKSRIAQSLQESAGSRKHLNNGGG